MTPLMYAVKDNRTTYLDRLIELGSDIGARNNVKSQFLNFAVFIFYLFARAGGCSTDHSG